MFVQAAFAVTTTVSILVAEHYIYRQFWPHAAHTTRYIAGVLALALPYTGLMAAWGQWLALAAFWAIVCTGGLAVLGCYGIDRIQRAVTENHERAERERLQGNVL